MIYFDNAATTYPKPASVIREMTACMQAAGGNPGRSGHPLSFAASEVVFEARNEIAGFFGSDHAENVVFTANCTHALNLAIGGIGRYGDHFLISNLEHNSVLRTMENLCRVRGMSYEMFDALQPNDRMLEEIDKKIRPRTRALVTTHASNICPRRLPIRELGALCRDRGILFVLDAAQSAGIYDISMRRDGISILCAPGHKGLYGPQGSGFALFADDFDFEGFEPTIFGGNGRNSAEREMGHESPDSYEAGTVSTPAIAGLCAGVRFVKALGRARIEESEHFLYRQATRILNGIQGVYQYLPEAEEGSLLLLGFDDHSPSEVAEKLSSFGICTRAGLHCAPTAHAALGTGGDALRISFSAMNALDEVTKFARVLESIL